MFRKLLGMDKQIPDTNTDMDMYSDSSSNIYNRTNIEDILYNKKVPIFLVIHSESCPACTQFMPEWGNLCNQIIKNNPNADNIEERSTPLVGSMYSENMNQLHDLYNGDNPVSIDDIVQYVPTIMKLTPNEGKIRVNKFDKKRNSKELMEFYNEFKKEMGVSSGSGSDSNHEPNISLQIQSGGYSSSSGRRVHKKKKRTKRNTKKRRRNKSSKRGVSTRPRTRTTTRTRRIKNRYKSKKKRKGEKKHK